MKNSQNNKKGVKNHLTSKGKNAQMRNKRAAKRGYTNGYRPAAPKVKMDKAKKLFIALVALICVFSISFVTLGTVLLVDIFGGVKYGSIYDEINLSEYIVLTSDVYKGQNVDLSGIYQAPYTLADMDDYIEGLRYDNRKLIAKTQKTTPLGYGDDFGHYIVSVFKDGKQILDKDWAGTNYIQSGTMTLGSGTFGDDFDAKLAALNVRPIDTDLRVRYNGTVSTSDVVAISYEIYAVNPNKIDKDDIFQSVFASSASKTLSGGRRDLAAMTEKGGKEAEIAAKIAENCKAIEQPFEFMVENYDIDGNGEITNKEKVVKFVATVNFAVIEEKTADVTFKLPGDYFTASDFDVNIDQEELDLYLSLNGAEVTFRLIITGSDDYELPTVNAAFIKDTLKFETDKTADADVIAAYKEYSLEELNKTLEKNLFQSYVSAMLNQFGKAAMENSAYTPNIYPEGTYEDAFYEAYDRMIAAYYQTYGTEPTTMDAMNQFTASYVYQNFGTQVSGLEDYCQQQAQSQVYQELLMYYIFRTEKLKITDEMLDAAYREYVDNLIASYGDEEVYNEAYFIEKYGGKDALYQTARRKLLVYRVVGEYLLENNNVTYTK